MKKVLIVVFLFFFILLGYKIFRFWHQRLWNGQSRLNLVIQSQPIFVTSLAPGEEMTILLIPDDTFVEAIHGFGFYRIKSIYNLGELEGWGGELLLGSIQEFLGVPLDGYAIMESFRFESGPKSEVVKKQLLNQVGGLLKSSKKTNLTVWDLILFWWQVKKIRPAKIRLVNLDQLGVCSETTLADGTRAVSVDSERLNQFVNQFFKDEKIRSENKALSVLNGTGQFGLAKKGARLISNLGGRVVEIGDWTPSVLNCQLRGARSLLKSYTAQKIKKIFDCQWVGEDLAGHRADLVVVLGEDYWQMLFKKKEGP